MVAAARSLCPVDTKAIRIQLAALNMTRATLSTTAAINPSIISQIVSGRLVPSMRQVLKIARALQLAPKDLYRERPLAVSTP